MFYLEAHLTSADRIHRHRSGSEGVCGRARGEVPPLRPRRATLLLEFAVRQSVASRRAPFESTFVSALPLSAPASSSPQVCM